MANLLDGILEKIRAVANDVQARSIQGHQNFQNYQQSTNPIAQAVQNIRTTTPATMNQNITNFANSIPNLNLPQPVLKAMPFNIVPTVQNAFNQSVLPVVKNRISTIGTELTVGTPEQHRMQAINNKITKVGFGGLTKEEKKIVTDDAINKAMVMGLSAPAEAEAGTSKFLLRAKPQDFEAEMNAANGRNLIDNLTVQKGQESIAGKPTLNMPTTNEMAAGEIKSYAGNPQMKDEFAKWVNTRRASNVEGLLKGKDFEILDAKGMQGIFDIQAGTNAQEYKGLRNYFDTKFGELKNAGVDINYQKDYIPQLWSNTQEEINKVFNPRSFTMKPSFSLEKVIQDYKTGIEGGLTPRFQRVSDLVKWYESTANKSLADVNYFKSLIGDGMVATGPNAPRDWVTLNPDRFPKFRVNMGDKLYQGTYKAPPELAQMINNYLATPNETLQKVADYVSGAKNRMLSFGVPSTAVNAHGFNILARSFMQDPIGGTVKAIGYMVNPNSAGRYLESNLAKAPFAIKSGLTLSTNEYKAFDEVIGESFRSQFGEKWNQMFEKPLFDKMIPALKLQKFYDVFNGFKNGGMAEEEAAKNAARFTNNLFGGFNWQELGKSPDWQNILRTTFLAPDWMRTNINLAGNVAKSFTTGLKAPQLAAYRKFAATFLGGYAVMNAINKLTSGHWMFQNDPGHTLEVDTGTYTNDGQKRYARVYGTAADAARVPLDVVASLKNGDPSEAGTIIRNRLSVLLQPLVSFITNTDYLGNPLFGRDKYGGSMTLAQNAAGVGSLLSPLIGAPSFLQSAADVVTGKKGLEQGLTSALEMPVRYTGGAFTNVQKQVKDLVPGFSGEQKNKLFNQLKGQSKFSDNQLEYIKNGDVQQNVNDILQKREVESNITKLKQAIKDGDQKQVDTLTKILDANVTKVGATDVASKTASEIVKEKIQDEINKAKVEATGKPLTVGNKYYYLNDNGNAAVLNITYTPPTKPELVGNSDIDKQILSNWKSDLTKRQSEIVKLFQLGVINQGQMISEWAQLKKLKDGSVNNGLKVKKLPKITLPKSTFKVPKIKVKSISKTPKLKTLKSKSYAFRKTL